MDKLYFELEYEWQPFTVRGEHLTFAQLCETQLFPNECSHWGPAIYKWEGLLTKPWSGRGVGRLGILIGETGDLKQRIQQYAENSSSRRDVIAREAFLLAGDIRLYVFRPHNATLNMDESLGAVQDSGAVPDSRRLYEALLLTNVAKRRALYQQLLVLGKAMQNRPYVWLVNGVGPDL